MYVSLARICSGALIHVGMTRIRPVWCHIREPGPIRSGAKGPEGAQQRGKYVAYREGDRRDSLSPFGGHDRLQVGLVGCAATLTMANVHHTYLEMQDPSTCSLLVHYFSTTSLLQLLYGFGSNIIRPVLFISAGDNPVGTYAG
jgi:hypothetical protein